MFTPRLWCIVVFLVSAAGVVPATSHAASHRRSAAKAKAEPPAKLTPSVEIAHVRFWKINEGPEGPSPLVRAGLATAGSATFTPVLLQQGRYETGSYSNFPAGPTVIEVSPSSDPAFSAPVRATAFLVPHGSTTVLVRQSPSGGLSAEAIDDSAIELGDLTIYNFLPSSLGPAQVAVADAASARLEAGKGSFRVRGLGRQLYPVSISLRDDQARNLHWNSEVDFRSYKRASLVLFLDAYGRVRGRVFPDEATSLSGSAR